MVKLLSLTFFVSASIRVYQIELEKKLATPAFSNIRNHCIAKFHPILDSNFEILGTYSENNLKLAESLWTHKEKPTIGSNETSVPLNCFK